MSTLLNDASTNDQRIAIQRFAEAQGMIHAGGDEVLEGVSGSKTFNRKDLKRLLLSAQSKKDYDVLLVYDSSRLTRGGPDHGAELRKKFARAGVFVTSVIDPVPKGDFSAVMHSLIDTQNNLYSKKLSAFIARGMVSARMRGELAAHGAVPLGIDRLYLRSDKTPFLRLQYAGNGKRILYNEETGKIISVFERGMRSGTAYKKQKGEFVTIVPGHPKIVAAVRDAFDQRYVKGWGYIRIGLELTRKGVHPFRSTLWAPSAVRSFLLNPTYLGWNYFMKTKGGLHNSCGLNGPEPVEIDQELLEERGLETLPRTPRPRAEMLRIDWPELREFIIDANVRAKAEVVISRYFDEHHIRKEKRPPRTERYIRYPTSPYILRGIVREPTVGKHFVGRVGQKKHNRYYHLRNCETFSEEGAVARRTIPAEPLEKVVLDIVRHVLTNGSRIERYVRQHVDNALSAQRPDTDRADLELELKELRARRKAIFTTANSTTLKDMADFLKSLDAREEAISLQLSLRPVSSMSTNSANVSAFVMNALPHFDAKLTGECYEKLRPVLSSIIREFTMNLETMSGELKLVLPEELLLGEKFDEMCATYSQVHSHVRVGNNPKEINIGVFRLIPRVSQWRGKLSAWAYDWNEVTNEDVTIVPGRAALTT